MSEGGSSISFHIEGLEHLQSILGQDWKAFLQSIALAAGELLRNALAVYPRPAHAPVIWVSERQRRWWFASRREAGLPFGYIRQSDPWSERLGPSWVVRTEGAMSAVVGTRVSYAPYVQADAAKGGLRQSPQNSMTGWVTDAEAVEKVQSSGDYKQMVQDAITRALTK